MNRMMNKLTKRTGLLLATAGMIFSVNVVAETDAMPSYMENALIDVCKAAESNNTIRFSQTLDSHRLDTQTVALKVVCNGENISDFAATRGAYKTAERLNESLDDVSIEDVALHSKNKLSVNY